MPAAFSICLTRMWSVSFDWLPPIFTLPGAALAASMKLLASWWGESPGTQSRNSSTAIAATGVRSSGLKASLATSGSSHSLLVAKMTLCGSPAAVLP